MMKSILFVASEGLPFIKSGGLADVIGSLPKILKARGYDVRVVLPLYKKIAEKNRDSFDYVGTTPIHSGWLNTEASYFMTTVDDVPYYFVQHAGYFERDHGLYGYGDDGERFSYFQRAVLEMLPVVNFFPDIMHCHDWHTGMVAAMCKLQYGNDERYKRIRHVFTIHNMAFQGIYPPVILESCLGMSYQYYDNGSMRFNDCVNFMKTAIEYSDKVTTVSPTYAQEILTPQFGEQLENVLRYREHDLWGIVNGIDTDSWNPSKDKLLKKNYTVKTAKQGKLENKRQLQRELGLRQDDNVLMVGLVSRLTSQKGLEMVREKLMEIMGCDIQFVVLGSGDAVYEDTFRWMEYNFKRRAVYYNGYNEDLAHLIYAGSDLFLMPSVFEPCGIGQLIAMRYGALPLVRETGGLRDTVHSYNAYTGEGNGFSFTHINAQDMVNVLKWACELYYTNRGAWDHLVEQAMQTDVSWEQSADLYEKLYHCM